MAESKKTTAKKAAPKNATEIKSVADMQKISLPSVRIWSRHAAHTVPVNS